jgi:hypothetical protein
VYFGLVLRPLLFSSTLLLLPLLLYTVQLRLLVLGIWQDGDQVSKVFLSDFSTPWSHFVLRWHHSCNTFALLCFSESGCLVSLSFEIRLSSQKNPSFV